MKQFGTEGRRAGVNEIPARDDIIEMICFRINLVENFFIIPGNSGSEVAEPTHPPVEVKDEPQKEAVKEDPPSLRKNYPVQPQN